MDGVKGWRDGVKGWMDGLKGWMDGWGEGMEGWGEGMDGWGEGMDGWAGISLRPIDPSIRWIDGAKGDTKNRETKNLEVEHVRGGTAR